MHGYFTVWSVKGYNALEALTWQRDIAAPTKNDALYVARTVTQSIPVVVTRFSAKPRMFDGYPKTIAVGYEEV